MVTKEQIAGLGLTMANERALLAAGEPGHYNAMTIGWALFGRLWNIPSATVFVRESRYTLGFMEKYGYFTISFYPKEWNSALAIMGTKSGRDIDKAAATGLTPKFTDKYVTFEQAYLTVVCRKMYSQWLDMEAFPKDVIEKHYPKKDDNHKMFAGEIVEIV